MRLKVFTIILEICLLIISITGCLPVDEKNVKSEKKTFTSGKEMSIKKTGNVYKMGFHKYPEEDIIMEILSKCAGLENAKWEITDKSEERIGFQYKDNIIIFNYEGEFISRVFFEAENYYEMTMDNDDWEVKKMDDTKEGREIKQQAEDMLKDFWIEDSFVGQWKKIDHKIYLMKIYQEIEQYTVSNLLVNASDKDALGLPPNMEIAWDKEGLKYCNINFYMDIKEVQQVELSYDYDKAEEKIKFYWEQKNGADEEWDWNYKVGKGKYMYIAYPDGINKNDIIEEYRPMWIFEVTKYTTGVGKNKAKGTEKLRKNSCVDVQTGEVFEGWR